LGKNVVSPDLSYLDFRVLLDMSTAVPTMKIINNSTVTNATNLSWIFEVISPLGTQIHIGSFDAPDIENAVFTEYLVAEKLPLQFGQLEFSNINPYAVKVSVRDSVDNVFDLTNAKNICKPNGNNGKNNFGRASVDIEVKCGQGLLHVKDATNLIYKNIVGTKVSTNVELTYPKDADGNEFTVPPVTMLPALLPIKYEGEGYEIYVAHIFDYDLGGGFIVRVRYSFNRVFPVWCNITLQPLLCEVTKISDTLKNSCGDNQEKRELFQKLTLANTYILQVHTAIMQPLSFAGFDVVKKIQEIKDILQIDCDCCRPQGISDVGTMKLTDALLSTNRVCGDMQMTWRNDGYGNIVLDYQNTSYTFDVNGTDAMKYEANMNGCIKNNTLFVDMKLFTQEMLITIRDNEDVKTFFNSLITQSQIVCSGLDGKNVINMNQCDYTVQISSRNGASVVYGVYLDHFYFAPQNLLVSNDSGVSAWLNSLSMGTFVVVYDGNTKMLTITSTNTNKVAAIYQDLDSRPTLFSSNCSFICTILQKMINFMDAIGLVNIKVGSDLTICGFNVDGSVKNTAIAETANSSELMTALIDAICSIVNYSKDRLVTCDNIRAIFATAVKPQNPGAGDIVLMYVDGKCQQVPLNDFTISLLKLIQSDSNVKNWYCNITPCSTVSGCSPVTGLTGSIADTTASFTWTTVGGAISYKWSIDGTNWNVVSGTAALVPGLTAATAYVFRVYPVYSHGDGNSCVVTLSFTTTSAGAACAAPGSLVLNSASLFGFVATWAAVTGASGYQYRINGGSWINNGTALTVTISGLTAGTAYNFEVRAIIGGVPCTESSDDSITTSLNFFASNTIAGDGAIHNVLGVSGLAFASDVGDLSGGESGDAFHTAFSGVIQVFIASGLSSGAQLTLYKNSVLVEVIDVPNDGLYSFASASFLVTDVIEITLTDVS
jgi:hypothetical protein